MWKKMNYVRWKFQSCVKQHVLLGFFSIFYSNIKSKQTRTRNSTWKRIHFSRANKKNVKLQITDKLKKNEGQYSSTRFAQGF